jgi:hypothetical protein
MPSELQFVVRPGPGKLADPERPYFVLRTDKWDDWGHKVQFHLSYIDSGVETRVGPVKILQRGDCGIRRLYGARNHQVARNIHSSE